MIDSIRAVRGYISMAVGFIACPCHLPITLPIVLSLTAGTAIGGWLSANTTVMYIASTILFVSGLGLGWLWQQHDSAASKSKSSPGDEVRWHRHKPGETCEYCQSRKQVPVQEHTLE